MKHKLFLRRLTFLMAFLLSFSTMWGAENTILYSANFSDSKWKNATWSQKNTNTPDVIDGCTFYAKNSNSTNQFSVPKGRLVWPANISTSNYYMAIPVSGVNGSITITAYDGTSSTRIKYATKEGTTIQAGSCPSASQTAAANPTTVTINDLTKSEYIVYIGRQGTSYTGITSLTITTPAPTGPTINASDVTINSDVTSGEIAYSISNPATGVNPAIKSTTGDWISNVAINTSTNKVTFSATANESTANDRTATITLSYTGATDKVITITQKKFVVDYVTLPFSLAAGTGKGSLPAGVTQSGLDTDYADDECKLKFNGAGDNIVIKTNQALGVFSFGLKMLGGTTSSTMTVKESSDGTVYTDVESFSTSGSDQSTLFTFTTTNAFNSATRYVKLEMTTKGSNVGVGLISIEEYVAPAPRTVTFNGSDKGTPAEASLTEAAIESGVTLPTVSNVTAGYQFLGWTATENGTTVDEGLTAGATYKPRKDITLYAVYGKVDYDITNQIEGATVTIKKGSTEVKKANVGDEITLSASKDEYVLNAWNVKDASNNPVTVTNHQFTMPASNVTINATFTEAAQSDVLIYKATLTSKTAATVTGSIGGTATLSLQLDNNNNKYKFGGTSHYITITLPVGQTFNEGDVLNIHTDVAAQANNNKIALFASNSAKTDADVLQSQANFTALGDNKLILNSAFENLNTLTIARTSTYNWNGYVDYVEVTRQPAILADPTCSATETTFNPECLAAVEMSVTAENYVYLQWYSCDAEGSNATAIAGANAATYSYTSTAAEEGTTKYFYCAAVNPKATNKTVKSEVIAVTVKMRPRYTITATMPNGGFYTVNAQSVDADHNSFEAVEGETITMTTTADGTHQLHSTPFVVEDADGTEVKVSKSGDNYTFTMPAKVVTVIAQYVATYSITAGDCTNGSVEVSTSRTSKGSKVTVTPTAAEHYHISAVYYVKEGEEEHNEISATDDVYSFSMVASNITVYAEFEEDDNVSITWSINGNTDRISKAYVGESISFPTDVEDVAGKKFQGWVGESDKDYTHETNAPTYVTEEVASEAKTFYAVFASAIGQESTDYSKITTMADLTDNDYVIAYDYNNGTQIAMGNTVSSSNKMSASNLTLSESKYANPDVDYIWSIKKVVDGDNTYYTIYNKDVNKYVKAISSDVSLVDDAYNFTITWDNSNSVFRIQSTTTTTYYLHGYVSGSSYDFRSSTAGNGDRYHLHLYKNESTIEYVAYCTTISGVEKTIGAGGWSTFCAGFDYKVSGGVAYSAEVEDGVVKLTSFDSETVFAAGTGVAIKAQPQTQYTITPAVADEKVSETGFVGFLKETNISGDGNAYYGIVTRNGNAEFAKAAATVTTLPAGKAFLCIPNTAAPARLDITILDRPNNPIVTGVDETLNKYVKSSKALINGKLYIIRDSKVFDMNGRLVK